MKKPKQGKYRIVVSLRPDLEARLRTAAKAKGWPMSLFIQEALLEKLAA